MKDAFIFDLDGTLCDCTPRVNKYLKEDNKDWDAFYKHCEEDKPIDNTVAILRVLANAGYDILFVSGRRESTRENTLQWLKNNNMADVAISEHLFLRGAEDGFRADYVCKMRNYNNHIKGKWKILGVFEDRHECVRAWRDVGLTCYQVAEGNY